ncbi:hypothetical protein FLAG1_10605 [Fusarium langsethiae]|uniref:Uncharacterized protein n=1 Tax=Fusarium langsethiae TaxID=179993 RepID=A0A0N0DBD4_FUSLA|nr:hypothetical protein FLAG1_10605 [Fusarium langsethiae]
MTKIARGARLCPSDLDEHVLPQNHQATCYMNPEYNKKDKEVAGLPGTHLSLSPSSSRLSTPTSEQGNLEGTFINGLFKDTRKSTNEWSDKDDDCTDEEGGHVAAYLLSCGHVHIRVVTCATLTSLCLASKRETSDAVSCDDLATLLPACYLLFLAERDAERLDGRQAGACIKCIWERAISRTKSLRSPCPLPVRTLFERNQFYKRSSKVMDLSSLRVINWFKSVSRVITILQFIPDFGLGKVDISDVESDSQAQRLYAVACLTLLNCKPPKDVSGQLLEIFSGVLWEAER